MANEKNDVRMYICPQCGPFCKVMREVWQPGTESPIGLEFINQGNNKVELALSIQIKEKDPSKPLLRYSRCGICDIYVGKPRKLSKLILDDFDDPFMDPFDDLVEDEEELKN